MTERWFSHYRLDTGEILGLSEKCLTPPTPAEGFGILEGTFDHLSQRVDLNTGAVIDWQPDKPAGDEYTDHEWDAGTKRWLPVLTLAGEKRAAEERVNVIRSAQHDVRRMAGPIAYRITKDRANLESIITGRTAVGAPPELTTKWRDDANVDHFLDAAGLGALAGAMLLAGQAIYDYSWVLKAQINTCETAEDLALIDLESGWP